MPAWLNVNTVFFTVLGYPMSYVEFTGTVLYLASVWLIARRNIWTWPVGIGSVLLYLALFWQIRLYSDALEQVYFLGASAYGWWYWTRGAPTGRDECAVRWGSVGSIALALGLTVVLALALGYVMRHIHLWLPAFFPEPASYPDIDAASTVLSFTAMLLMARKRVESWLLWVVVDVVGIGLYYVKEVRFIALLYVVLLVLALRGYWNWRGAARAPAATRTVTRGGA